MCRRKQCPEPLTSHTEVRSSGGSALTSEGFVLVVAGACAPYIIENGACTTPCHHLCSGTTSHRQCAHAPFCVVSGHRRAARPSRHAGAYAHLCVSAGACAPFHGMHHFMALVVNGMGGVHIIVSG